MLSAENFKKATFSALNDPQLRGNFKRAMSGLIQKRLGLPIYLYECDQSQRIFSGILALWNCC